MGKRFKLGSRQTILGKGGSCCSGTVDIGRTMWESSLGDKTCMGDGKMGISSVEGFDRDAKFVCEKGMTLLLLIKSEGLEQIVN
jgi:hypothetical protein